MSDVPAVAPARRWTVLVIAGLATGLFSGLFGVGGAVIVVPALTTFLRFPQRVASGTSLLALLPMAVVGAVAYELQGAGGFPLGLVVGAGAVVGGLIGSWLLARIPGRVLAWLFIVCIFAVVAQMFFVTPVRDPAPALSWPLGLVLFAIGIGAGVLSGLLGIGGGIVLVPAMILGLHLSDIVTKSASLVAIIPNSISTTIANATRRNVDIGAGLVLGFCGAITAIIGTVIANAIPPQAATIAYATVMLLMALQMIWQQLRRGRA